MVEIQLVGATEVEGELTATVVAKILGLQLTVVVVASLVATPVVVAVSMVLVAWLLWSGKNEIY